MKAVPGDWVDAAACQGRPQAIFFPATTGVGGSVWASAKQICATCPVLVACREYALAADERDGVWGGLDPSERRQILSDRAAAARKARVGA